MNPSPPTLPPRRLPALARDVVVAAAFMLVWLNLHTLAVAFETAPGASAWYPARGLGLALLLVFGLRHGVSLALASLIGGVSYHLPAHPGHWLLAAALIAGGTTAAAWSLRRLGFEGSLRLRDAVLLAVVAAAAEVFIAAGVVAIHLRNGLLAPTEYGAVVLEFFVGDYLGILIVVPLALVLARGPARPGPASAPSLARLPEVVLLAAVAGALLWLSVGVAASGPNAHGRWYLLLLPLALAAVRFGPAGAAVASFGLSVGVVAVVRGAGAAAQPLDLQLLMLAFCVVGLLLGGAVADRSRSQAALAAAREADAARARREAERARASKARFLAATTHDLRPPYEAVRLGLETLALHPLPPSAQEIVRRTDAAVRSMGRVIHSVLDTARLEGELRAALPRAVPLRPLLQAAVSEAATLHGGGERGVRLRCADWHAVCDAPLVERLVRNLLANAVRAASPRGRVLVAVRRTGLGLRVEVRDTGPGIPASQVSTLFEDFVTHVPGGTGIGLSLVREIAQGLRLGLGVRSRPGAGTVISFELPLAAASRALHPEAARAMDRLRDRVCALSVADGLRRESLAAVLSDWGCAVVSGPSGWVVRRELQRLGSRAELVVCEGESSEEAPAAACAVRLRDDEDGDSARHPAHAALRSTPLSEDLTAIVTAAHPAVR